MRIFLALIAFTVLVTQANAQFRRGAIQRANMVCGPNGCQPAQNVGYAQPMQWAYQPQQFQPQPQYLPLHGPQVIYQPNYQPMYQPAYSVPYQTFMGQGMVCGPNGCFPRR